MQAVRNMLRRFGFISIVLLMMTAAVQPASAACGSDREPIQAIQIDGQAVSATPASDDCAKDCQDCLLACSHGCCHAPTLGVIGTPAVFLAAPAFDRPAPWGNVLAVPDDQRTGPERPPRA